MSIKTFQHGKAVGNARKTARATMVPILRDFIGQDVYGDAETIYGAERTEVTSTIFADPSTITSVLAYGRLETMSGEEAQSDAMTRHEEPYNLYWLPTNWSDGRNDYANPQSLGADLNGNISQGVETIIAGMRIWMPINYNDAPGNWEGIEFYEFNVLSASRVGGGDVIEFQCKVNRTEGTQARIMQTP